VTEHGAPRERMMLERFARAVGITVTGLHGGAREPALKSRGNNLVAIASLIAALALVILVASLSVPLIVGLWNIACAHRLLLSC
jgi:hypothetical protein